MTHEEIIEDDEEEIITIVVEYEDGTEEECEILATIELDNKQYVALLPMDKDEYKVFGYQEFEEEVKLINIEDENEKERVIKAFDEYFQNEEEEEDYDDEDHEDDEIEQEEDEDS